MVVQTEQELEMATPGETDTPPSSTETASPQSSVIGSPDPEQRSSPVVIGSPEPMDNENEISKGMDEPEPVVEMPMSPPPPADDMADETPAAEAEMSPADEAPDEGCDKKVPDNDQTDQANEMITEVATAQDTSAEQKEGDTIVEAAEEICKAETVKATSKAENAFASVKESAHNAVEAIGNKVAKLFGNMRKVKSLLHINEAAEPGKLDQDSKAVSNSTGNINNIANSIKSKACVIL